MENLTRTETVKNDSGTFVFTQYNRMFTVKMLEDYAKTPVPATNYELCKTPNWFPDWKGNIKIAKGLSSGTGNLNAYILNGTIYGVDSLSYPDARVMGFIFTLIDNPQELS